VRCIVLHVCVGLVLLFPCLAAAGLFTGATFTEDFENGFDGWTLWHGSGTTDWRISTPLVAHSGMNVAYSSVLDAYRTQAIISPELTAGDSAVLVDYYHLYNNQGSDEVSLKISVNDGAWQMVKLYPTAGNGIPRTVGMYAAQVPNYLTNMSVYLHETIDLSSFLSANDTFKLIFYTGADYNYPSPGWAVDDITVTGLIPEPGASSLMIFICAIIFLRRWWIERR